MEEKNIGVSLTKLGANFDFGIDDLTNAFEGGIKTLAEENIKINIPNPPWLSNNGNDSREYLFKYKKISTHFAHF